MPWNAFAVRIGIRSMRSSAGEVTRRRTLVTWCNPSSRIFWEAISLLEPAAFAKSIAKKALVVTSYGTLSTTVRQAPGRFAQPPD
jgi:hypothetical protein